MTDLTKAAREALEACETALRHFTKTPSTLADSTARGNAHAALATLRAALSEAPGESAALPPLPECYVTSGGRDLWSEEQVIEYATRAMLAARPSVPQVEPAAWLCEYRSGEEFVSLAKDPMRDPDVMSAVPLYAASSAAPTVAQHHSAEACADDVYQRGESVGLFAVPKEVAEAAVQLASQITGDRYDWHYIAGRVHVKRLAEPTVALAEEQWQPIETAPPTRTLLVWHKQYGAVTAHIVTGDLWAVYTPGVPMLFQKYLTPAPTHWMHRPDAPGKEGGA